MILPFETHCYYCHKDVKNFIEHVQENHKERVNISPCTPACKEEKEMTKDELVKKLNGINLKLDSDGYSDIERNHKDADVLLLEFIGDKEVSEAFNNLRKWYA